MDRPLRIQEFGPPRNSRKLANEVGTFASLKHRPPVPLVDKLVFSYLLEAELKAGNYWVWSIKTMKKFQRSYRESTPRSSGL